MPGFNKRGPEGMGPMTGGGRGFCNSSNRSFSGRGSGRGRGLGNSRGAGMGGRAGFENSGFDYANKGQEENALRSQVSTLKDELEAIEKRLQTMKDTE